MFVTSRIQSCLIQNIYVSVFTICFHIKFHMPDSTASLLIAAVLKAEYRPSISRGRSVAVLESTKSILAKAA